ncbi:MAG TPA: hypothetical protein VF297_30505 [Pyrinomonadaceae bacterium]
MAIPRSVHARLVERFIFNFRMPPEAFARRLPTTWLKPQVCNGWSVVSFCILKLDQVMISPLPGSFGFETISCAYRCGVMDISGGREESSVYITDRNTDLPMIARLAPFLFLDTIPMVRVSIERTGDVVDIRATYLDRQPLFSAQVTRGELTSKVFPTVDDFAYFIKGGVSSYTPSIFGDQLARVDLAKEDASYEALDAKVDYSWLDGVWPGEGLEYDSAIRATGGLYKWTYRGLKSY